MGVVVDTGIWVDLERGKVSPEDVKAVTGSEPVFLSPVSIAELTYGAERAQNAALRMQRHSALAQLKRSPILRIDETTGEIFGQIAAATHQRAPSHRVQDLWLASQAIQHGFKLLTNNPKDFKDIPGLQLATLPKGKAT